MSGPSDPTAPTPPTLPELPDSGTSTSAEDREFLRNLLAGLGIDLPVSMTDLSGAAKRLRELQKLTGQAMIDVGLSAHTGDIFGLAAKFSNLADLQDQLYEASKLFEGYAGEYAGGLSESMRPAMPKIARLPTSKEFLSDYDNAFDTALNDVAGIGSGLGPNEMAFAREVLRPQLLSKYTGELGKIAETGASPFYLEEVTAEQRGLGGAPTIDGQAATPPVTPPATVPAGAEGTAPPVDPAAAQAYQAQTAQVQEAAKAIEAAGGSVSREFVAMPKVLPLDFLKTELTPARIKLLYEGSARGAGRFTPAGDFSVRRV